MSNFLQALAICGVGLLVLLLILTFLALLVNGMTSWIKVKDENDEQDEGEGEEEEKHLVSEDQGVAEKAAALGVAFALAELGMSPASGVSENGEFLAWREYHRARRLNQAIRMRRN